MSEKIRIYNKTKFNIGIKTPANMMGVNIRPGSFTVVEESDIDYLMSTCNLLQKGLLQVEEKAKEDTLAKMGIDENEHAAFMNDEDIKKKLGGSAKNLEKWIADVEDPIELNRIADMAKELNLSLSKLKIIQDKVPQRDLMSE